MFLSSFAIIITKQLTLSVTWPFDSSPALYYKRSIVTVSLFCTVTETCRLKCWTHAHTHAQTLRWFYTLSNANRTRVQPIGTVRLAPVTGVWPARLWRP